MLSFASLTLYREKTNDDDGDAAQLQDLGVQMWFDNIISDSLEVVDEEQKCCDIFSSCKRFHPIMEYVHRKSKTQTDLMLTT